MNALFDSIVDNDLERVAGMVAAYPGLAIQTTGEDKLFQSRIFHWIYVGDTALHLAAAGYRVEIAGALLGAGADPNAAGNRRRSRPLHYASDGFLNGPEWDPQRQLATIKLLLDAGADLNAQDQNGATALHRAVRTRCAAAAMFLLAAGSDPTSRNKSGSARSSRRSCHSASAPNFATANADLFWTPHRATGYETCSPECDNCKQESPLPRGSGAVEIPAFNRETDLRPLSLATGL